VYTGGLSKPSKMPGYAYGLPAKSCKIGAQLAKEPGTVCSACYALKGNYVRFKNVALAQERRLASIGKPGWAENMVRLIEHYSPEVFRWHDSGDIQSANHLRRIVNIATALPGTKFWLPTREVHTVRVFMTNNSVPSNLCIRVSALALDTRAAPKYAGLAGLPTSTVHKNALPIAGKGNLACRANERDGTCGNCRACWDTRIDNVSYPAH